MWPAPHMFSVAGGISASKTVEYVPVAAGLRDQQPLHLILISCWLAVVRGAPELVCERSRVLVPFAMDDEKAFHHRTSTDMLRCSGPSAQPTAAAFQGLQQSGVDKRASLEDSGRELGRLVRQGAPIPASVLYHFLKGCTAQKDLLLGRLVHALALASGHEFNTFLANHIIRMYAAVGRLMEALQVYTRLPAPDSYMRASIILAHVEHGQPLQAIELYQQMRQTTVKLDDYIFAAVLKACSVAKDLVHGKQVHSDILESGTTVSAYVGNCLVDMYGKCGSLEDARRVFDNLVSKDVVSWTAMIAGYSQHGLYQEALSLYSYMERTSTIPANVVTFVCLLKACASTGNLQRGKELLAKIQGRGLDTDVVMGSSLVDMYAKCGSLDDARRLFDRLPRKNVVTWNAMIGGYAQYGLGQEALTLYASMEREGRTAADQVTFLCLLKACASVGDLHQGRQLHSQIQKRRLAADVVVGSSLVDMYAKCGSLEDARKVFDGLHSKNVVTWNAMITGYTQHGLGQEALTLYSDMQLDYPGSEDHFTFAGILRACAAIGALKEGKDLHLRIEGRRLTADAILGSSLVNMYVKCGSLEDARRVFDELQTKDVVTWTTIIAGYVQHGLVQEALTLYRRMWQEGLTSPNHCTFVSLLRACASIRALSDGKELHSHVKQCQLEADVDIGGSLVLMYAECGSLDDARRVFDRLPIRDVVAWNALIGGYAQHGLGHEALFLYARMQQEAMAQADQDTLVGLLKACASVGAWQRGKDLHSEIKARGLESDVIIGSSLIDMYSKCGSLEDARRLFDRLSSKDVVTWNALLHGYAQCNNTEMVFGCFQEMQQHRVEPDATTFLSLLTACSRDGLVGAAQQYLQLMVDDHGIKPNEHHLCCMVDVLARSGNLDEAENMLQTMSSQDAVVGWTSLLSACRIYGDAERGRRCFGHLTQLEPHNATPYVLLGNIYAKTGRWGDVESLEGLRKAAGAYRKPARAWIELNGKVHPFTVGEKRDDISSTLKSVNLRLEKDGSHVPHTELVLKPLPEEEKEDALCGHAEKLALAYGLLNTPDGSPLLVTKNLRMCADCHSGTKVVSRTEQREIIVRDARCVHRFVNGFCSCGDRH